MTQRDHFTLMQTETEGEAQLRQRITELSDRIGYLENVCIGLVELLHEHGIDAEPIDGLDDYDPPAPPAEGGEHG